MTDYRDHRLYHAAQTGDRRATERGWDFRMESIVDQSPFWIRFLEVMFRPTTLFALAVLGISVALLVVSQ